MQNDPWMGGFLLRNRIQLQNKARTSIRYNSKVRCLIVNSKCPLHLEIKNLQYVWEEDLIEIEEMGDSDRLIWSPQMNGVHN